MMATGAIKGFSICKSPEWYNISGLRISDCYYQSHGMGRTSADALSQAWGAVISSIGASHTSQIESRLSDIQKSTNGIRIDSTSIESISQGTVFNDGSRIFKIVELFQTTDPCEDGLYHAYLLVCLSNFNCACTIQYPSNTAAVCRSVILPGWGQIYKGKTKRGIRFSTFSLALAGGAVTSFILSSQNQTRAANARTDPTRQHYTSWRDGTYYCGIGLSVCFAGVYIWNIFDAKNTRGIPKLE